MLMVIIMITGDFLGMSLTTDHVRPRRSPIPGNTQSDTRSILMGIGEIVFLRCHIGLRKIFNRIRPRIIKDLGFCVDVFGNQQLRITIANDDDLVLPSERWVVLSSVADVLIASILSLAGIAMKPLPIRVVAARLRQQLLLRSFSIL